jgi:cation diffusion facilitator family transporter
MSQRAATSRDPGVRAGLVSLAAGVAILGLKVVAYLYTGSMALLADAAESIVNVVAAAIVTYSVAVSRRPPDADHPYGHGKAQMVSAMVEGGLILAAAGAIAVEAVRRIIAGPVLQHIGVGIAVSAAAGLANLVLGAYLLRVSRRERSEALHADGIHVLSDTVTTAGALVALGVVQLTGWVLLDPIAALLVAGNIVWAGTAVVRKSLTGLLDEADFSLLVRLGQRIESARRPEWCDIHQLRSRASGQRTHLDLHLVVPRYFTMDEAHRTGDLFEAELAQEFEGEADFVVHLDPCRPSHCSGCAMPACPVRAAPLEKPVAFTAAHLTQAGQI